MNLVKFNRDNGKSVAPGVNDIFESIFNDTFFSERIVNRVPAVNISESTNQYHIELAAPGLKKQDFKVSLDGDVLNVSVEQQLQKNERKFNKREYSYSSFVRSFILPELTDQDSVKAAYEDGVLKIDVAKKENAKSITRQIEIK